MNPLQSLGNPLGAPLSGSRPEGEHGAGTGLSGGHGVANASNTQSGGLTGGQSGFNAGLGGEHASGDIPHGHSGSSHPIADKFSSGNTGAGFGESKLDNKLDQFSGADRTGHSSGLTGGDAVSGAYAGSGTDEALTGESHAHRTGAGVGPLGENLQGGSHGHSGAALGAGALGAGALGGAAYGTGVGASGGAGGHYTDASNTHGEHGIHGNPREHGNHGESRSSATDPNATKGHFGTVEKDFDRGAPLSKDLDTGGPHSLVFQESTGKYVHRHEIEGSGSATKHD